MRHALPLALLIGCSYSPGVAPDSGAGSGDVGDAPDGALPNTKHVRMIDINDAYVIAGPHADFPLLVSLTAQPWLRATAAGGQVSSGSGFDIIFSTDRAGTQRLAHELEAYRGSAGDLIAWVKLPTLTPTTTLYIHYGDPGITSSQENPAAVWSTGYAGVWHLGTSLADAKGTSPGTNTGTLDADGLIDRGRQFDGIDDRIDFGSATAIDDVFTTGGTAEIWAHANTWGESSRGRLFEKSDTTSGTGTTGWNFCLDNYNVTGSILFGQAATQNEGMWDAQSGSMSIGTWSHIAVVYNATTAPTVPHLYINGQSVAISTVFTMAGAITSDAPYTLMIGGRTSTDRTFDGVLDEARVSSVPRSAGWIETEYRNQAAPSAFYTVSEEL